MEVILSNSSFFSKNYTGDLYFAGSRKCREGARKYPKGNFVSSVLCMQFIPGGRAFSFGPRLKQAMLWLKQLSPWPFIGPVHFSLQIHFQQNEFGLSTLFFIWCHAPLIADVWCSIRGCSQCRSFWVESTPARCFSLFAVLCLLASADTSDTSRYRYIL